MSSFLLFAWLILLAGAILSRVNRRFKSIRLIGDGAFPFLLYITAPDLWPVCLALFFLIYSVEIIRIYRETRNS
ncbi:hypothetical protein [Brevibacillus borstelensis]|uniref:hypothetical protein n=1 Tax=Brevibacillus borstelensis TaxID=45462 RepID=UPI0030C1B2B6